MARYIATVEISYSDEVAPAEVRELLQFAIEEARQDGKLEGGLVQPECKHIDVMLVEEALEA